MRNGRGDDDGSRYRASYFEMFPGVWRHGDWIEITSRGTAVISGRSDSTINRGGVRIGTAEIYRAVEVNPGQTRGDALVIDKWFALQATIPEPATTQRVVKLMSHPDFSLSNPNRVRSLVGAFAHRNFAGELRGLLRRSSGLATITPSLTSDQTPSRSPCWKARFTRRSSPE